MRVLVLAFMLAIHAIFIGASALAFIDYVRPPDSWRGIFYIGITTVLGLPWSIGVWALGLLDSAAVWLGVIVNYCFLSWITVDALGSAVRKQRTEPLAGAEGMTIPTMACWGIFVPVVLFAGASLLLAAVAPHDSWERSGLLHFSVAAIPGIGVANWWILPVAFRTRNHVFFAGLFLPLMALLLEVVWLLNANWIATRVHASIAWIIVLLFLLPLIFSFLFIRQNPRDTAHPAQ
jgi:hypothetical protein